VLLLAKTVTAVLAVVTLPDPSMKVTLGNEPMVTELATFTP